MFKDTERLAYYAMILPGLLLLFAFTFVPLAYSVIAFQKFNPALGVLGSPWVGLDNILYMFSLRDARQVFFNTVFIATMKMAVVLVAAVAFALLLNEVRFLRIQRSIQTMVYLPHFLSWVILSSLYIGLDVQT
jgi:putative aldouronate transport system permease protein